MKKNIKIFLSVFVIITVFLIGGFILKNNKQSITTILSRKDYAYLPREAKEYVKRVYEETGDLIHTEKNKEDGEPYLNPDYVEYLKNDKNKNYGHIPEKYITDHSYKNDIVAKQGDSSEKVSRPYYNLRDDGYITNIYDQGSEGICWSFASTTSLESYFAIKSNKTKMLTFSEKQVDYATTKAEKAIDIGSNPYIKENDIIGETLNEGGNMLRYANSTAIGISPVMCEGNCSSGVDYNSNNTITSNKYWKYNYNFNSKLSPYEVTNIDNTEYSLNEFIHFDPLSSNDQADVDALVSLIKNQIVNKGSLYVSVGAYTNLSIKYTPTGSEQAMNADGKNVIYYIPYGWDPNPSTNHAVSLIGWDDNYTHNICLNKTDFEITDAKKVGNNYSCTKGDLYTINGAWIVQNSWGNNNTFIYLPYNTMKSAYDSINDVSEVDYDNSYRATQKSNTFTKGNTKETVKKVKFFLSYYNRTVRIFYRENTNEIIVDSSFSSNSGVLLKSQKYTRPGLYTIDISDNNIVFDEETTEFKLTYYGDYISHDYFGSIHTSNVNDDKFIDLTKINKFDEKILTKCTLEDNKCVSEPHAISFNDNNVFIVSGTTRGLTSNDNLIFRILNQNQEDVTNSFHIFRDYSVSNYFNTLLSYNSDEVPLGTYTIEVYYNNNKYDELEWKLTKHNNTLSGIGTENNPYVIKTASDLNNLKNQNTRGNYYILNNDLDLTYDTTNSKGLFYNSGAGWLPIDDFYGSFDGNNHIISGLYINRPSNVSDGPVGIFNTIYGTNSYIKNLIIKDANINGNYKAGALAGSVSIADGIEISNISVVGGKVNSSYYNGGLIGGINQANDTTESINCNIYNIYSNTIVGDTNTSFAGGIIGVIEGKSTSKVLNTTISDSVSFSKVSGDGVKGSSAIGGIVGVVSSHNNITVNDVISAGSYKTKSTTKLGDIVGYAHNNNNINVRNTYYINKVKGTFENNTNENLSNNSYVTLQSIISSNYTNNFNNSSYWTKPTVNSFRRFPMPNILTSIFDFTETINDFELKVSGTKNIYDLIAPNTDNAKNIEWTYDEEYLTISSAGVITPKKEGVTTIHIKSLYDGYQDDIQVTISQMSTVTFKSNTPADETNTQEVAVNKDFNLAKNTFTYKGHTFKRWNTKADGTGSNFYDEQLIEDGINADLTLYAQWDAIEYTIFLNPNGGTGNVSTWETEYISGTLSFGSPLGTKENYTFKDWNTKPDGTGISFPGGYNADIIFDDIPFDEENKVTLYAQWEKVKYNVIFDSNGGTGTMDNQQYVFDENKALTLNTFTKTGHSFRNWNTKADGSGTTYTDGQVISVSGNMRIYAQWDPNEEIVTFDSNGGTGTMPNQSFYYNVSQKINDNKFTRENYIFDSWNTKADGTGTRYINKQSIKVTSNTTLYAQWEKVKYDVIFNSNGGIGTMDNQQYAFDDNKALNLNTFTRTGYIFKEWNTKADGSGTTYEAGKVISINKELVLYAQWEKTITEIRLSKTNVVMNVGETTTVNAEVIPSDTALSKEITWTSDNDKIATVSSNGKITGKKAGTTIVKATAVNGVSANVTVEIKDPIYFQDVPTDSWFYEAVKYAYQNRIIMGYNKQEFGSYDYVTRGQLVTMLWRLEGEPETNNIQNRFTDVDVNSYYGAGVKWASANGIVNGYGGTNKFGPGDPIIRQDFTVILNNYIRYKGLEQEGTQDLKIFADYNRVAGGYAEHAIRWATTYGVMNGMTIDGKKYISPFSNTTRAETAALLSNLVQRFNLIQ